MQGGRLFHQLLGFWIAMWLLQEINTGKNEENVEKLHREKKRKKIAYTRYL